MSTIGKFQKLTTTDYNLNKVQENVASAINSISIQPLVTGNLLASVVLVVGNNTVYHNLGAPLVGWLVTRMRDGYTQLYDMQTTNPTPDKTLVLNSSAPVTIDLVVF